MHRNFLTLRLRPGMAFLQVPVVLLRLSASRQGSAPPLTRMVAAVAYDDAKTKRRRINKSALHREVGLRAKISSTSPAGYAHVGMPANANARGFASGNSRTHADGSETPRRRLASCILVLERQHPRYRCQMHGFVRICYISVHYCFFFFTGNPHCEISLSHRGFLQSSPGLEPSQR